MFYQLQVEANSPPPAPIVDSSELLEQVEALDRASEPTELNRPEPVQQMDQPVERALSEPDDAAPAGLTRRVEIALTAVPAESAELAEQSVAAEIPDPIEEVAVVKEVVSEADTASEADVPAQDSVRTTEGKFIEEAMLAHEQPEVSEAASEAPLSLADNPLVVAEDVPAPAELDNATRATGPAGSPPTRVVAPSIDLDSEVIEVGWQPVVQDGLTTNVWVVADFAAGWHQNSALPGQGGNIVLSGHHNIKGQVFRYLVDVEVGQTISLYVGDQRYDYAVHDKFIVKDKGEPEAVRRANARWIGPFNEERLTLVTCWPFNSNTHRLIVIARPI